MRRSLVHGSQWDEFRAMYDHGDPVLYVYRRGPGQVYFEPWVVVAQSALLKRVGRSGLGLYAARPFKRDDYIGRYGGTRIGPFASRKTALLAPEVRALLRQGRDKLVVVRAQPSGFEVIDGETGGAPYLHRCNDPRNTALLANAELTDGGYVRVTQSRVPAFDIDKPLAENARAELRLDYGEDYWELQELIGTSSDYAIEL